MSDVHIGYQLTLAVPSAYTEGFSGRAFLMETEQSSPTFRTALSVEAINENYLCSLDIFLGDVKVWSSSPLSQFYTREKCVLELTLYGDLRLKDENERIGWRSGTSGQGVERLHLLRTGNLVLVDSLNLIKWQSFNFPTDIMMWGQRLSSETRLTSFPINSSNLFYSFEIQYDKIALYLNFGSWKYSYWEFRPSIKKNITFVQLSSKGLEIFTGKHKRIDQITSNGPEPLRFLALRNNTGNLELYHYSAERGNFEESYEALNNTCDLPLACNPYGICTSSNMCSCIRLIESHGFQSDCSARNIEGLCGRNQAEMLELRGAITVLNGIPNKANATKEVCANVCLDDCSCVAAQYKNSGECFLYKFIRGIKQVERGSSLIFMVKRPKGEDEGHGRHSGLQKWVIIVVGVVDGFIIFLVLGGVGYYVIRKKLKNSSVTGQET
ncbi:D-mannose binding lectin protein with Apple-like carbohydrate-binding domain [Abeliophyllum distichum]|uniref:D-mannose binding lectin protein with Apple-like carbohydrate-binding domain n=1 Tax=Abeliophyllum distichum TaxID=126358 RepID=A0ABD1VVJ8_9LAMI